MQFTGKVFGVGLARTGTTSLHRAMGILGIDSAPTSVALLDGLDRTFLERHDAFFDNPIPFRYRELADLCRDAGWDTRWIITQRPIEGWLTSMQWLFSAGLDRLDPETRQLGHRVHRVVYGIDTFDADILTAVYHNHYRDLAEWSKTRNHVWLHLDQGFEWTPICELVDRPVPAAKFPHVNAAQRRGRRGWRRDSFGR